MNEVSITFACAFQGIENMICDIGFGFNVEAGGCNIMVKLRGINGSAEISIE